MNTEQAAKMLIVAWIKDWNMRTLLDIIDEKANQKVTQERLDIVNKNYPFISNILHIYVTNKGKGMAAKPYVAHLSKILNDKLWDIEDNLKKLNCHTFVQTLKFEKNNNLSKFNKEDAKELKKDRKNFRETNAGYIQSRVAYKLQRNTNWFQVK